MGLHKSTRNTLTFAMARTTSFIEDLSPKTPFHPHVISSYQSLRLTKIAEMVHENTPAGPALLTTNWMKPHQMSRHMITRVTSHGFHHKICLTVGNHTLNTSSCICKLCNQL